MNKQFSMVNSTKLIILMLCIVSYGTTSAQDSTDQKRYAILVDLAQPIIGQVQAGVLIPAKPHLDVFVFGRYNYNYVPESIGDYYYRSNVPTFCYTSADAKETGFTLGGQARFLFGGETEYTKYLKPRRTNLKPRRTNVVGYVGGWFEYGSSISESTRIKYSDQYGKQYYYPNANGNVEGEVPNSTLTWANISGGALAGLKIDLSKSLLVDIYTGLGVRYITGEMLEPGAEYNSTTGISKYTGTMHSLVVDNTRLTTRLGLQLGYKF
tara:strand:- start:1270 stop:2070 length:801 start_codon:yes stop_codon:yes gene_type:complete